MTEHPVGCDEAKRNRTENQSTLSMPNYRRNFVSGGTFFFTVVTQHRTRLFDCQDTRTCLRNAVQHVRRNHPFTIDAIVLLPDHLHCIWTLPAYDTDYSNRWSRIKALFSQSYGSLRSEEAELTASRSKRGERGFWQRRFYEHTVNDEADFKRCVDYVHIDPLKHALVDRVIDWQWSSFHRYVRMGTYTKNWGSAPEFYGDEWLAME